MYENWHVAMYQNIKFDIQYQWLIPNTYAHDIAYYNWYIKELW